MRNIKLTYQYDGSDFLGFQRQINTRTVQGELEIVLKKFFKEDVNLTTSGRTDRGVHASMQVSNFITSSPIPVEKIKNLLNNHLPKDIYIDLVEEVDLSFNSRFSAKQRTYEYFITNNPSPFSKRFATFFKGDINTEEFQNILSPLIGRHDFKNFRLADCGSENQIREIYDIQVLSVKEDTFKVIIIGNSFLKSQIRIIIGTALEIYTGKKNKNYFYRMLHENIYFPKIVAEPNGLFLSKIIY